MQKNSTQQVSGLTLGAGGDAQAALYPDTWAIAANTYQAFLAFLFFSHILLLHVLSLFLQGLQQGLDFFLHNREGLRKEDYVLNQTAGQAFMCHFKKNGLKYGSKKDIG